MKSKNSDERIKLLREIAGRNRQPAIGLEQDVNDLFFASMAKMVKKLPEIQQARLRMQISNIVANAEIEFLSERPSCPPSCPSSESSYAEFSPRNEDLEFLFMTSPPQPSLVTPTNDQYTLTKLK